MTTRTSRATGGGRTARSRASAAQDEPVVRASFTGTAGRRQMQDEQERAEELERQRQNTPRQPFRYFIKPNTTGEYVIIDDEPTFFRYEHSLQNPRTGRWDLHAPCVKEVADCPICASGGDRYSTFNMYLTILDLVPYVTDDGDEIPWSKKLLVIPPRSQKRFTRLLEKEGSLRGLVVEVERAGSQTARIGEIIDVVEVFDEDTLLEYERTFTDTKGEEHEIIGHEPFPYEELMPDMSLGALRRLVGGSAPAGSRADNDRSLGRRGGRGSSRDDPPARGSRQGRGDRARDEDQDDPPARGRGRRQEHDDDHQDDPPARGRGRRQEHDDDQQGEPPVRTRQPRGRTEDQDDPPVRGRGRREPEEADQQDDPPARGRGRRQEAQEDDPPARGRGRTQSQRDPEDNPAPRGMRTGRQPAPDPTNLADMDDDIPF
ncbi:hypothetical protein [Alcaligenes faecalis]|uniref:hypothetical protein n=1 Tax=Alcaligenes faecalis TaxID=511 RepID=UPI000690250D|nr:hypothetical protein [Alcaligenes faecalis]